MNSLFSENKNFKQVKITRIKEEAPGVKTFTLQPVNDVITYNSGQFLTFAFEHHHKEERRSYSISSTPVLNEPLAITLKRVDNGVYSRWLADRARLGDILYTTGAAGLFTLPGDIGDRKQVFFFAAGIGITPVFSLLKTILYTCPTTHVVLVYSNRNKEEAIFYDELVQLQSDFGDRLQIEFLFSSAFDLSRARLSKWLLPTLVHEYALIPRQDILYYLCGPFTYMRMVIFGLEELDVPATNIRKENFVPMADVPKILPPDTASHTINLQIGSSQYHFAVQYPESILQKAKKTGIPIPYSCEAGQCGSCTVICRQGNVWMSYNEVLTDADIAAGKVLTCTGYPINGDVTLEL